jgi:hypothetical protein
MTDGEHVLLITTRNSSLDPWQLVTYDMQGPIAAFGLSLHVCCMYRRRRTAQRVNTMTSFSSDSNNTPLQYIFSTYLLLAVTKQREIVQ